MNDLTKLMGNKATVFAVLRLVVTVVCTLGAMVGWSLDADFLFNLLLTLIAFAALVYFAWWRNAPITKAAQLAQELLGGLKSGEVSECEVESVIEQDNLCEENEIEHDDTSDGAENPENAEEDEGPEDDNEPKG